MKVVIVGPTGVGKTKMSIELAKWLDAGVINCDAVQVYQELNIGSAKVTEEEKEGINHYLFDLKSPKDEYTVKDYQKDVRDILDNNKDRNLILVGGTGLYACAALYDYRFLEDIDSNDYDDLSNEELYQLALAKDENCQIDKNNRVRLLRFIKKNHNCVEPKLLYPDTIFIGLTTDRSNLYDIINKRVDKMIDAGSIKEVEELYHKYQDSSILKRAIGYKEIISYLKKEISLEDAINLIKKNSRHYAKRQYTWFNNKMNINWFNVNYDNFELTIKEVENFISSCQDN